MAGNARISTGLEPNPGDLPGQPPLRQSTVHIGRRLFLVGCPRSGTTLLQSMLAAHPRIASFPETHFFERVSPRFASVGMASPKRRDRRRLLQFLSEVGHPEMECLIPRYAVTLRRSVGAFVEVLDALTLAQGGTVWVEKTPGHLHCIHLVEAHIPATLISSTWYAMEKTSSGPPLRGEHRAPRGVGCSSHSGGMRYPLDRRPEIDPRAHSQTTAHAGPL